MKILIVDDEKSIVNIIKYNLTKEGYDTIEAFNGEDGLKLFAQEKPDLVLLDLMMPKVDGMTVCKKIREKSQVPVIILTARAEESDKVLGLETGADDYITKPFGVKELIARVKANMRRVVIEDSKAINKQQNIEQDMLVYGDLTIDQKKFTVSKRGMELELTLREYELIKFLATQKGEVFSRESLLEKVWGYEFYGDVRTVDVTIRRLREKVEDMPGKPAYIITKRGVGYFFDIPEKTN